MTFTNGIRQEVQREDEEALGMFEFEFEANWPDTSVSSVCTVTPQAVFRLSKRRRLTSTTQLASDASTCLQGACRAQLSLGTPRDAALAPPFLMAAHLPKVPLAHS